MNKLLVILVVFITLLSLVQNAPVGRQRGKNKNKSKQAERVRGSWESFHRLEMNNNSKLQKYTNFSNLQRMQKLDWNIQWPEKLCMGRICVFSWKCSTEGRETTFFSSYMRRTEKSKGSRSMESIVRKTRPTWLKRKQLKWLKDTLLILACYPVSSGANEQERERQN